MPWKSAKPCRTHACKRLQVKGGYCRECLSRINGQYNAHRNTGAIYDSNWQKLSKMLLRQYPVCQCGSPARLVHHVKPLSEGGDKYEEANLQTVCIGCHNRLHNRFNHNINDNEQIGGDRVLPATGSQSGVIPTRVRKRVFYSLPEGVKGEK